MNNIWSAWDNFQKLYFVFFSADFDSLFAQNDSCVTQVGKLLRIIIVLGYDMVFPFWVFLAVSLLYLLLVSTDLLRRFFHLLRLLIVPIIFSDNFDAMLITNSFLLIVVYNGLP